MPYRPKKKTSRYDINAYENDPYFIRECFCEMLDYTKYTKKEFSDWCELEEYQVDYVPDGTKVDTQSKPANVVTCWLDKDDKIIKAK